MFATMLQVSWRWEKSIIWNPVFNRNLILLTLKGRKQSWLRWNWNSKRKGWRNVAKHIAWPATNSASSPFYISCNIICKFYSRSFFDVSKFDSWESYMKIICCRYWIVNVIHWACLQDYMCTLQVKQNEPNHLYELTKKNE